MKYGYARVSSKGQDYIAQVEALKAAGCEKIFSEKASGKSTDGRPEFKKLLKALLPGDVVVVTKLDRLARSSRNLHNVLHELEGLSCGCVSLGEAWCRFKPVGRSALATRAVAPSCRRRSRTSKRGSPFTTAGFAAACGARCWVRLRRSPESCIHITILVMGAPYQRANNRNSPFVPHNELHT